MTEQSVVTEPQPQQPGWAETEEIPNGFGPRGDLPLIELPDARGSLSLTEGAKNLFAILAGKRTYFARGGAIMKLGRDSDGTLILTAVTAEEARSDFEKVGRLVFQRKLKDETVLKEGVCPVDIAKALLATEEAKNLLPQVRYLVNCPIIYERHNELAIAAEDYDASNKVLITRARPIPQVPLETAVPALLDLHGEYDFQSAGDKARALASMIGPALSMGRFIRGRVPADVAEADQSQSGKTYRQKVLAAVYNEHLGLVANKQGGVGSVDEAFATVLVKGRPFIQFDNFRGRLDSQYLEAFMTADGLFDCRIPHKGYFEVRPEDYFIFMSSNGVETTKDFANRSNIIRIRKKPEGFHFRQYEEGSLLDQVRANQPFYLGCVFSVIREWHRQGKPRTKETRHDFRDWVQVVDWIVQNIFQLCPIMEGHRSAQERVSNPEMVFARAVVLALAQKEQLGNAQTATEIAEVCEAEGIKVPGLNLSGDIERAKRAVGCSFARLFKATDELEIEEYKFRREIIKVPRADGKGTENSKHYTVNLAKPAETAVPINATPSPHNPTIFNDPNSKFSKKVQAAA